MTFEFVNGQRQIRRLRAVNAASMIQRRLSVGFNRATRLMEELEMAGVIGPAEGTKPRKVLQQ